MSHEQYEERDASPRFVLGLIIGLFLLIVVVLGGTKILLPSLYGELETHSESEITPPAPRLQVAPAEEWQSLKSTQEAQLHSYGWIDDENSVAHIPIERAMELIVIRGLTETKVTEESQ